MILKSHDLRVFHAYVSFKNNPPAPSFEMKVSKMRTIKTSLFDGNSLLESIFKKKGITCLTEFLK